MNIGDWCCICVIPGFVLVGVLFGIGKERAARFISGFNMLPNKEQELYDKAYMARDIRNSCFLWAGIMAIGALLSWLLTAYMAIGAYVVWGILFFRDVHVDAHKAFEKYLKK